MKFGQQKTDGMSVGFLSYEYPPNIYGGVGVHVNELTRHLAQSIQQVHVFTSYVEELKSQMAGSVYVHRSSKPLVPASNRSSNAFEKRTSNFNFNLNLNVPVMMKNYISSEKLDLLHSHGGLSRMAATEAQKTTHLPPVMTTQSAGISRPNSDRISVVMEQDVVDEMNIPITISRSMRGELNQSFGVDRLDGQKMEDVYAHRSSKFLVPASNYSKKDFERIITNINVAGMVEKYISGKKLDLLHSHGGLIQMAATEAQKTTHLPLVMTAHSLEINRLRPDNLSILMEQNVVDRVDRFIAVSESIRKELNQTFGIGYNNITVIPNGVDTAVFKHQNADDIR
ncbi:MAG: glycosyltransferase, partial [Methanosarcinaceae archaeon]|nr:glycosyltransferase [Methanosarcinaceae archaeon]